MGMTSKWIKSFLTSGKKNREKEEEKNSSSKPTSIPTENPTTPIIIPPATPKEKRRWSFRRSSAKATTTKDLNSPGTTVSTSAPAAHSALMEAENEQKQHDMAVATAQAAVTVIHQTNASAAAALPRSIEVQDVAAIKIQAAFRCYLAKKALGALKGLVKLQALVRGQLVRKRRGQLVRKRASAILRCMQTLVTVQERAQSQQLQSAGDAKPVVQRQSIHRKSSQDIRRQASGVIDTDLEKNIKIVEMDLGKPRGSSRSRNSYSNYPQERVDPRFSAYYPSNSPNLKQDHLQNSPALSALTEMSSRACSGHYEECSFTTAESSPQYYSAVSKLDPTITPFAFPQNEYAGSASIDYPFYPRYMGNTQSSKAKVRSHSAPKQRSESYERQTSGRRSTMEGSNNPRGVRMQRSSSHVGSTLHSYQHPWSIKLDRSTVSLKDSECGSTSTVVTNASYCRSLFAYEPEGNRY